MHLLIPFASAVSEACRHVLRDARAAESREPRRPARAAGARRRRRVQPVAAARTRARARPSAGRGPTAPCPGPRTRGRADGIDTGDRRLGPAHAGALARRPRPDQPGRSGAARARAKPSRARCSRRCVRCSRARASCCSAARRTPGTRRTTSLAELRHAPRSTASSAATSTSGCATRSRTHAACAGCRTRCRCCCYEHPLNEAREARGGRSVNSFWLSGCGRAQAGDVRCRAVRSTTPCARRRSPRTGPPGPRPGSALDAGPLALRCAACAAARPSADACAASASAQRFESAAAGPVLSRAAHGAGGAPTPQPLLEGAVDRCPSHTRSDCATCRRAPPGRSSRPACIRCSRACSRPAACARADELDDGLARLLPPADLNGAREAARLLADAIGAGQRIFIVADYDCDGATACAVALRGLAHARRRAGRAALRGARSRACTATA